MPKMSHPDHARPLSVQPDEVDERTAAGWTLLDAPEPVEKAPAKKTATKSAVTRKSVKKS